MKTKNFHLSIFLVFLLLISAVVLIVFAPGYWEYQQIRWRTELSSTQIEAGMTGVLATTKATEELLGHGDLNSGDFRMVSAAMLKTIQEIVSNLSGTGMASLKARPIPKISVVV